MITFKFIPANQIISYYIDDIDRHIAKKRSAALQHYSSALLTVEESGGKYFLVSGFKFYDALYKLEEKRQIPCKVTKTKSTSETERMLNILEQGVNHESTSWRFKYELIFKLTKNDNLRSLDIANYINKDITFVENFMVEPQVPNDYKKRAIRAYKTDLLNAIYLHPAIPDEKKEDFYELAISGDLTHLQLYLITSHFQLSYYGIYAHPYALYRIVY